jgi:hypothetical protein
VPYTSVVRDVERLNPAGIFGTEEEPGWTGRTKAFPEPPPRARLISYLTGMRLYETDRAEQKEKWGREQKDLYITYGIRRQYALGQGNTALAEHYRELMKDIQRQITTAP